MTLKSSHIQEFPPELQPTRDNIIQGWRKHLAQAGEGDQVLFCYSGHGSQIKNPEEKAAEIYREFGLPQNEKQKVELASKLIQGGLAGTDVFSDLMKSVDKDSANAIQSENLIVKSIERLSENYVDSGVGTMNDILTPVEQLIGQYMTAAEAPDGTIVLEG